MNRDFVHVVLTRFNTAVSYAPLARRLDTTWLQSRLQLFEQYCLPSMASQRNAEFRWIVFCDEESPTWFHDKMNSYRPLLNPLFVSGLLTDDRIAASLAREGYVDAPHLITTRLDNDDALANHHLSLVQSEFRRQEREFIAFPIGIQLFRGHLYNVFWPSNPFVSLIEKIGEDNHFTTVCCVRHDHLRGVAKVRTLMRSAQWLQVIHGNNVGNSLRGWPRLQSRMHRDFDITWSATESDSLHRRIMNTASAYGERAKRWLSARARVA